MIEVTETTNEEGKVSFIISWDENDPQESLFNNFTEKDFIDLLMYYCKQNTECNEEQTEEFNYYHEENNEAP
ncbi:MAG: hypothetical protein ACO32T_07265 [Candidatus Nanopelagicaceae bacterium]